MKKLTTMVALGATLALFIACGDDDDGGGPGGSGGMAGAGTGGSDTGGNGTGAQNVGGMGGLGAPMCDSPEPPSFAGSAGSAGSAGAAGEALAIVGSYVDDFDGVHEFTNSTYTSFGTYHISFVSNEESFFVARNDQDNDFNPCLWSRVDWTFDGDDLYVCQSVFDAPSEGAALAANPPNADELDSSCGGFAWSKLTPQ